MLQGWSGCQPSPPDVLAPAFGAAACSRRRRHCCYSQGQDAGLARCHCCCSHNSRTSSLLPLPLAQCDGVGCAGLAAGDAALLLSPRSIQFSPGPGEILSQLHGLLRQASPNLT